MLPTHPTTASVSVLEQDMATLDTFAEKTLQETQISELMMAEPKLVQRGAIYLISTILSFSICLLYFGKVPVWVSARGRIIPEGMSKNSMTTERLPKIPSLLTITQSQSNLNLTTFTGKPLITKAAIPNKDIGFVKVGMPARIKVDAYPFQQFGSVPARVQQIVPNIGNEDNFTITLELLQDFIIVDDHEIRLFPGLTVQAEIQTRNQRLFELLLNQ